MVEKAPGFIDVTDVQFKLQKKVNIFNGDIDVKPNCQLVATASAFGLVFVASPLPELKVIQLASITGDEFPIDNAPMRTIPLPSEAIQIAVNCDNTLLAVDVVINGITMIVLYAVQSFLSHQVKVLQSIRLSPDNGIRSKQLAWNPTIPGVLAVCLENGALSMFVLKEQGFEFHTVDKSQAISSVCWSPKGKQIVAGCPNGKLIQYKPDLKPIRVIDCPLDTQGIPLVAIAIQWLSTYQFAVAFAPVGEPAPPSLYVVNAPKNGQISCINYEDICYSGSGPRQTEVFLIHILPWNTLLMASANSMEVGVLATNETGDAPVWKQWCMLDEARAELPLTAKKQESYPIGFALETGCTHRVTVGEAELPVMPLLHLLSTDGVLVSFNILNTIPNIPGICSPPRPLADTTGLGEFVAVALIQKPQPIQPIPAKPQATSITPPGKENDLSFAPAVASTPFGQPKAKGLFGNTDAFKAPVSAFGGWNQQPAQGVTKVAPTLGNNENIPKVTTTFGASLGAPTPFASVPTKTLPVVAKPKPATVEPSKPLITVPPTYTASQVSQVAERKAVAPSVIPLDDANNAVIQKMMVEEVQTFEKELKDFLKRSQNIDTQIGSPDTMATMTRQLRELTDLMSQATESNDSLNADVHSLTQSLNEAFMMSAEAKSKWDVVQNPTYTNMNLLSGANQTNRRQLSRLQAALTTNRVQLEEIHKKIDSIWVMHEEEKKQYKKDRMMVPKVEVIYQTINYQREILMGYQKRLNDIKKKLDVKMNRCKVGEIESLSESIVSLGLVEPDDAVGKKLSATKLRKLQDALKNHAVRTIHPKRPERKGINSEIVYEKREAAARAKIPQESQKVPPSAFTFGGTATQPVKVVSEAKVPPATRPVAKAKPGTTKNVTVPDSKPIPMTSKVATGAFELGKTFTAPVVFEPKPETRSFIFGKADAEENKPTQPEAVFGIKVNAPAITKPSVASPTVAALLTKSPISNENVKLESDDAKSAAEQKPAAFSFNIQKSPLGVFNQGNKVNLFAQSNAPVSSSIFSQLSQAPNSTAATSIFSGLSFGSQSASIPDKVPPVITVPTVKGTIVTPETVAIASKQTEDQKKESSGFKLTFPALPAVTKESSAAEPVSFASSEITITPTIAKPTTTTTSTFDAENILKNLSFCKPSVPDKEADAKPASIFGGFGSSSTTPSSVFGTGITSPSVAGTPSSVFGSVSTSTPSSVFATVSATTPSSVFGSVSTTTPSSVFGSVSTTTPSSVFGTVSVTTPSSVFATVSATTPSSVFGSVSVTTPSSVFGSVSATKTPSTTAGNTFELPKASATASNEPFNLTFGSMGLTTATPATTAPPTATSPPSGLFSSMLKTDAQPFGAAQTTTTVASPFASLATTGSPFTPATTATTATTSSFGSSGGSIFGSSTAFQTATSTSGFGTPTKGTPGIFGGASSFGQQTPPSAGSIFGGGMTPSTPTGSIFGGTSPAVSTPSVFGGSAFGSVQSTPTGVFGGGMDSNAAAGFTGFAQQPEQQGFGATSAFGRTSFGSNTAAFAQGGASVAQTGFGSPSNVFAKPTPAFGSSPTFGGTPAFGSAAPTFGGAATFGSPLKSSGFGTFSNTASSFASPPPAQQNNLFAALGSSDSGMTFGNLAQNNNANQAKMQFGGSAFSTWRQ